MESLQCVVEYKKFPKEKNENKQNKTSTQPKDDIIFRVLGCSVKGHYGCVTIIGDMPDVNVGDSINVEGDWKVTKYGKQFQVEKWEEILPSDIYGIEQYLASGMIAGIGPVYAKKIVAKFGLETFDIIDKEPERLSEVDGIGQTKINKIAKSWQDHREVRNIVLFLQKYNIQISLASKIYKTYGSESIAKIQNNPYRLADDIQGIGFKTADDIAGKMGFKKNDYARLCSGLIYALKELSTEGHCFAFRDQLLGKASKLLKVNFSELESALNDLVQTDSVVVNKDAIYLRPYYYAEKGCAKRLIALLTTRKNVEMNADRVLSMLQDDFDFEYDEIQVQAIRKAISSKVMVLTGGPGTGKTTTTEGIIAAYETANQKILLAAPTGRAAKRMSEATGIPASTIHRLIEYQKDGECLRNEDNPLEGDVLILDECSMIDIQLMYKLLKAVPDHMTLILVGDVDQLPSVGAGNVLLDIINSGIVPVVRLTRIFRQAQNSKIVTNAHKINHGELPDVKPDKDSDFFLAPLKDDNDIANLVVSYCFEKLPKYYGVDPIQDIQVLTPMKKGPCGTIALNQLLQEKLNPQRICLKHGGTEYRLHDKVMQTKNNYDKLVFNGDAGIITSVDIENEELEVTYDDKTVTYDILDLDELMLSYAITIHKSQGSEFPIVIIPMTMSHYIMLQRNLLYTGITRAKKTLILIGDQSAVKCAVQNEKISQRNTRLIERLKENL